MENVFYTFLLYDESVNCLPNLFGKGLQIALCRSLINIARLEIRKRSLELLKTLLLSRNGYLVRIHNALLGRGNKVQHEITVQKFAGQHIHLQNGHVLQVILLCRKIIAQGKEVRPIFAERIGNDCQKTLQCSACRRCIDLFPLRNQGCKLCNTCRCLLIFFDHILIIREDKQFAEPLELCRQIKLLLLFQHE